MAEEKQEEEEVNLQEDGIELAAEEIAKEQPEEEDDDDNKSHASSSTSEPPPYVAPPELRLSRQEEGWIWDIVYWFECHGEEEGLTKPRDYEFVLYGFLTKGNTDEAAERMKGMKRFKETYIVQDTIEEGIAAIRDFIQLHPGVLLHLEAFRADGVVFTEGGSLLAFDWGKFVPAVAKENLQNLMLFIYYTDLICCSPNFDAARGGVRHLWEAGSGFSRENIDVDLEQLLFTELLSHIPVDFKEIRIYNTNFFFNWLIMMIKPFMPLKIRDSLSYGCQIEMVERDGSPFNFLFGNVPRLTLADVYLRPSYEVAMQNLLTKAETHLTEYYRNLLTFEF